jgi:NAD(P)-dependent dehydrogenase (short-subunit alcohol dehydrogenase family)
MSTNKLSGKIALITGGSSGIGLATAKQFVSEGAYIFITALRQPELDAAVKLIERNVTGIRSDVSASQTSTVSMPPLKAKRSRHSLVNAAGGARSGVGTPTFFINRDLMMNG